MPRSYRTVADKVDNLDALCPKCEANGRERTVYPGFKHCYQHLARSQRALVRQQKDLTAVGQRGGLYARQVSDAIKLLRIEAEKLGELGDLSDTSLSNELVLGRLLMADWLKKHENDDNLPLKDLLECLNLISKIARLAQTISTSDEGAIKQDLLRAIITAISHAFHKANLGRTPEERAVIFSEEISRIFAGRHHEERPPALPSGDDDRPTIVDGEAQEV